MIEKKEDKKAQDRNREINSYIYVNTCEENKVQISSREVTSCFWSKKIHIWIHWSGFKSNIFIWPTSHSLGPRKLFLGL